MQSRTVPERADGISCRVSDSPSDNSYPLSPYPFRTSVLSFPLFPFSVLPSSDCIPRNYFLIYMIFYLFFKLKYSIRRILFHIFSAFFSIKRALYKKIKDIIYKLNLLYANCTSPHCEPPVKRTARNAGSRSAFRLSLPVGTLPVLEQHFDALVRHRIEAPLSGSRLLL